VTTIKWGKIFESKITNLRREPSYSTGTYLTRVNNTGNKTGRSTISALGNHTEPDLGGEAISLHFSKKSTDSLHFFWF